MLLAVLIKQKSAFTPKIISFINEAVSTCIISLTVGDESLYRTTVEDAYPT